MNPPLLVKLKLMKAILVDTGKANAVEVRRARFLCSASSKGDVKYTPRSLQIQKQKQIKPDSIVYTDHYRSYNVLDVSEFKHYRINHSKLFADKQNHINGIENFWNQAKRHMRKFNGVPKSHFPLFLKECEWRFNNPKPKSQLKQLKQLVKQYMG